MSSPSFLQMVRKSSSRIHRYEEGHTEYGGNSSSTGSRKLRSSESRCWVLQPIRAKADGSRAHEGRHCHNSHRGRPAAASSRASSRASRTWSWTTQYGFSLGWSQRCPSYARSCQTSRTERCVVMIQIVLSVPDVDPVVIRPDYSFRVGQADASRWWAGGNDHGSHFVVLPQ